MEGDSKTQYAQGGLFIDSERNAWAASWFGVVDWLTIILDFESE